MLLPYRPLFSVLQDQLCFHERQGIPFDRRGVMGVFHFKSLFKGLQGILRDMAYACLVLISFFQ